ncbi:orexin receptor type 2-like [Saccostrea echinata]|uniref:orexin receptor type 2-like n=1 Tax=Saccostrea echinata TaxID=191078 RepID=UPI002A807955|nr:orexin receptor type 2-like [Saccostrea echinata]
MMNYSNETVLTKTDEEWYREVLEFITPDPEHWVLIGMFVVIFLLGLGGNLLVCLAVWKNHNLRTLTNVHLVNLAVADFLVVAICLPPTLLHDAMESWFLGTLGCKVVTYFQKVSVLVSVLTLTTIGLERYLGICHLMSDFLPRIKTRVALLIIWIVALVTAVPDLYYMTVIPDDVIPATVNLLKSCRPKDGKAEVTQQLIIFVVFFIIPFAIMGFAYTNIFICLWHSTKNLPNINAEHGASVVIRNRKTTAKMLIVVVVAFFGCNLPVYILNILRYFKVLNSMEHAEIKSFSLTSHLLLYLSSAVNPVIYTIMSGKFRSTFRKMICIDVTICKCLKKDNTRSYSQTTDSTTTKSPPEELCLMTTDTIKFPQDM